METQSVIKNQFSISQFDEYYLPSVNRNTFEKLDSKTLYKQKYRKEIFKEDTLHIIFGLDSGLLVNYILENDRPNGSKYIFIELPEILNLLNVDIPESKSSYIKIFSLEQLAEHLESSQDDIFLVKSQSMITLSLAASSGVIEAYTELFNTGHRIISHHSSLQKSLFEQKIFVKQQLKNISDNQIPASILNNQFKGKMAIIVGGGPSFDNHKAWIKTHYHNLFVISVSRMAAILSNAGIPAHIIVSVDPQDHSFEVSRDMMPLFNESIFINSHHVNHRIISQWQGTSLYLGDAMPWKPELNNIPTVGPTVTNSALRIAIEYGFKDILLSGVDLCHSSKGITHAQGTVEAKAGTNNSIINEWVETYAGDIAETPIQLVYAAQSLEEEAATYPNVKISNLSINAAKVRGINYQSIDKITPPSSSCSPQDLFTMVDNLSSPQDSYFENKHTEQRSAATAFSAINSLSKQAITLNSELRKQKDNPKKYQILTSKIESVEQNLIDNYSEYCDVIKYFGYYEFSKFLTTKETKEWTVDEMNNMTYQYYNAFLVISKTLLDLINQSIDMVNLRIEERKIKPSIALLSEGWLKHNQPGRANIWFSTLNKEQTDNLSENETSLIKALQDNYQDQLVSLSDPYFSMGKANQLLINTQTKILDLKQKNNSSGLQILLAGLKPLIQDDVLAFRLFYLAQHYIYIIDNDFKSALKALQKIDKEQLTEVEYKQILIISLKLHMLDLAEETAYLLTQYSDEYYIKYAHMLVLQGKHQLALNCYLDYLEKYPDDESVLIKLGEFMVKLGEKENAISVFNQILSINAENMTAINYLAKMS